mmetsp:Transcript_1755/g.2886  ORF Transcript_1755/g.2886 Transcript_1755/m.2886 type:complete len:81 (-) Transcript_1755:1463-1705(-)
MPAESGPAQFQASFPTDAEIKDQARKDDDSEGTRCSLLYRRNCAPIHSKKSTAAIRTQREKWRSLLRKVLLFVLNRKDGD